MHQPILRKDTKADRRPPPVEINQSVYATSEDRAAASAAGREAAEWLARITKEQH